MVQVLLADDEKIIRDGLTRNIGWERLGMEVVGVASDGVEAERLFHRYRPQLVITDVRMPHRDGLQLIAAIKKAEPDTHCIVISGHEEFALAQHSLRLGVEDYILKPIDPAYLEEKLRRFATQHAETPSSQSEAARIRRLLDTAIFCALPGTEIRTLFRDEDPLLADSYYRVLSVEIDRFYTLEKDLSAESMEELLHHFYRLPVECGVSTPAHRLAEHTSGYSMCLYERSAEGVKRWSAELAKRLMERLEGAAYTVTVGVSRTVIGPARLRDAYSEATDLVEERFLSGGNRAFFGDDAARTSGAETFSPAPSEENTAVLHALREGEEREVGETAEALMTSALSSPSPRAALSWTATELFREAVKTLSSLELSIEEIVEDPVAFLNDILNAETARAITDRTVHFLVRVHRYIQTRRDNHKTAILGEVKSHVDRQFTRPGITLEEVAGVAGMSPSYFAVIFKQVTGATFNRYLTRLRINKAKDLLLYSDLKAYEIAESVGYESSSYFARVFRKIEGLSPSEYKQTYA